MTVLTEHTYVRFRGNGTTRVFPFNMRVPEQQYLEVWVQDAATGTLLYQVSSGQYDATGIDVENDGGGTITYPPVGTPLDSTRYIVIRRRVPYYQELDLLNQGGFSPEAVEYQLDKLEFQIQQLAEAAAGDTSGGAVEPPVHTGWYNVVDDGGVDPEAGEDTYLALQSIIDTNVGSVIFFPPGTYLLSQELKLPSYTHIFGADMYETVLMLMDGAGSDNNVLTNAANDRTLSNAGNTGITIANLTVDGNYDRELPEGDTGVGPDTAGCGVGFAFVSRSVVKDVFARNCTKHGIDVGAKKYSVDGGDPTFYQPGPSTRVSLINCETTNNGDDGITTHFSRHIYIENPHCYDSGGHLVPTNSNGIEIDDGSYDVLIVGGYVKNCIRGIEIKAHDWAPAASRVQVIGLRVEACTRSFQLRHIGFRQADLGETQSASAKDVDLVNCSSIAPTYIEGASVTPCHLSIHSYQGVRVVNFSADGEGDLTPPTGENEDILFHEDVAAASWNTSNEEITVANNADQWTTGTPITLTSSGTLPAGFVAGTFYYVIRVDATHLKLATGLVNALAGTAINLTDQGTGTHTLYKLESPLAIGVHFFAQDVSFDGVVMKNLQQVAEGIRYTGSCVKNLKFNNIVSRNCSGVVLAGSGSVPDVEFNNISAETTFAAPTPNAVVQITYLPSTQHYSWKNVRGVGYTNLMTLGTPGNNIAAAFNSLGYIGQVIAGNSYSVANGSVVIASTTGVSSSVRSAIIASSDTPTVSGDKSLISHSSGGTASGERSAILGGATGCVASGERAAVMQSSDSEASAIASGVVFSRAVLNSSTYTLALGYDTDARATNNRKVEFQSITGNINAAGTITGSAVFADIAELLENHVEGVIPLGTILTMEAGKVRQAELGDAIVGVVSATAGLVLGDTPFTWAQRYLTGAFGEPLYDEVDDPDWVAEVPPAWWPDGFVCPEGELVANPVPCPRLRVPRPNPEFDPDLPNVSRRDRPAEWTVVGILGQLFVRVDENVAAGDYVNELGGVSVTPTPLRCMYVKQEFDEGEGYAIAKCFMQNWRSA